MAVRPEVIPFLAAALAAGAFLALILRRFAPCRHGARGVGAVFVAVLAGFMLFFFRDPERASPSDARAIVAGADGRVTSVTDLHEPRFLKTDAVRISIRLSLLDVHVNRAPIAGQVRDVRYVRGKRFFTYREKSSEYNQRNSIYIVGDRTSCLVNQITGPWVRRVVCWRDAGQPVARGDRIGMMKFGSRLDMYFPRDQVEVTIRAGEKVRAGESVVARLRTAEGP